MKRPITTDDLLAAYAGNDAEAVRRVLEAFLSGDAEESIKSHIHGFVKRSIKEIVKNIEDGKKPNADRAFLLKRENRKPNSTSRRNREIARELQELRNAGEKKDVAITMMSGKYSLSTDSIAKIYKNGKAGAVRDLKLIQEAGEREGRIAVETFWRQKLAGDELLLETFLRHERSLIGRGG